MLERRQTEFHDAMERLMLIDPTFPEDLANSYQAVFRAMVMWGEKGYSTMLPQADVNNGTDDGDFFVLMPISVKRLTRDFHSIESYPFSTIFLGTVHGTDAMLPGPYQIMIFNPGMTGMIVVPGSTRPHWTKTKKVSRNRTREFYQVTKEYCQYVNLSPKTKQVEM